MFSAVWAACRCLSAVLCVRVRCASWSRGVLCCVGSLQVPPAVMSLGRARALEALWRLPSAPRLSAALCPSLCRSLSGAGSRCGPTSPELQQQAQQRPAKNTSKAMMAYLERATKHGESYRVMPPNTVSRTESCHQTR